MNIVAGLLAIAFAVVWFPVKCVFWFSMILLEAASAVASGVFDDE